MVSKIMFLGTGGGRMNMITQLRATAGIYAELSGARLYLDPGPGALVKSRENRLRLENLDAILASHCHIDHTNDAGALIEAMTRGTREKRGILAGSHSALEGSDKSITSYHQGCVEKKLSIAPGDEFSIGSLRVTATPTEHTDRTGIGFVFHAEKEISYLSDTNYSKKIASHHKASHVIILNCLYLKWDEKKAEGSSQKHMDAEDAKKFVKEINPELAILQHFGMGMILHGPWKTAKEIQDETGVKTVAAKDNQVFEFGKKPSALGNWLRR